MRWRRHTTELAAEIRTAGIGGFSAQQQHDAASEEKTMIELAQEFDVHPNQISVLWSIMLE